MNFRLFWLKTLSYEATDLLRLLLTVQDYPDLSSKVKTVVDLTAWMSLIEYLDNFKESLSDVLVVWCVERRHQSKTWNEGDRLRSSKYQGT